MLSIEVRIAEPIAVPRAVVKLSIASINAFLSVVGGTCRPATPAKATSPILVLPSWDSMKETAASWATVSRLGSTSVEHMDPETSIASMIVVELVGTGTVTCGRAAPTPSVAKPRRSNMVGMSRVHLVRGGSAGPYEGDRGHPHRRAPPTSPQQPDDPRHDWDDQQR